MFADSWATEDSGESIPSHGGLTDKLDRHQMVIAIIVKRQQMLECFVRKIRNND